MRACINGLLECAEALMDAGAAVDMVDNDGRTALMRACHFGHHECALALIEAGAAVDMVDNNGNTALLWGCNNGYHECVQAMINAGASVDMVNNNGNTALMHACDHGHHECAQALIDAHADLEPMNRDGQNALMVACESPPSHFTQSRSQGRVKCALSLLAATAPIREPDSPDRAASLKFACGRLELIEVVLASTHAIEDAPPLANAGALKTDAQDIVVTFASDWLASRPR